METEGTGIDIDLANRLQRSRGRSGRTFVASAKVTRAEQQELEQAARLAGKALSEWSRDILLREARRRDGDALFTELIATRMLLVNLLKPLITGKAVSQEWITEVMAAVRKEKRKAAQEVRQQYNEDSTGGR